MNDVERLALHHLAANTIEIIAEKFGNGRTGGYLYYLPKDGPMAHIPIGRLDLVTYAKYQMLSREKAKRLTEHSRHWLSSESRQPEREQYAGAARGNNGIIISFSGMPESIDEVLTLAYLVAMDWCTFDQALERLAVSPIANLAAFHAINEIVMLTVSGGRLMR